MLRRAAVPPFTHAVSLLANMPCRRVGARDEHVPLTLEERAPMQAQGPLHLCVTQGRQTLKTPFTDLLLGKRRGSRRHRRRRRKCLLLGWRHVQRTKRSEEPRLENDGEEAEEMRVAATPSKKFRRLEGDTAVTKLGNRALNSSVGCELCSYHMLPTHCKSATAFLDAWKLCRLQ